MSKLYMVSENVKINDSSKDPDISIYVRQLDRKELDNFLLTGIRSDAEHFVDKCLECIGNDKEEFQLLIKYMLLNFTFTAAQFLEKRGNSRSLLDHALTELNNISFCAESLKKIRSVLIEILELCIDLRDQLSGSQYSLWVNKTKEYIADRYFDQEISLEKAAKSIHVNASYLSAIFSREAGKTFIEYLTEVRLEQAAKLLQNPDITTSEVSSSVGYQNVNYFYRIFKKSFGCTPGEYKEMMSA